jgi:hypothetical protein
MFLNFAELWIPLGDFECIPEKKKKFENAGQMCELSVIASAEKRGSGRFRLGSDV